MTTTKTTISRLPAFQYQHPSCCRPRISALIISRLLLLLLAKRLLTSRKHSKSILRQSYSLMLNLRFYLQMPLIFLSQVLRVRKSTNTSTSASKEASPSDPDNTYELSVICVTSASTPTDVSSHSSSCSTGSDCTFSCDNGPVKPSRWSSSTESPHSLHPISSSPSSYDRTTSLACFSELRGWSHGMFR